MEDKPRYEIGDKVWHAGTQQSRTRVVCPDCNDTRKWKAESPAGETFEFDCPRCGWMHDNPISVMELTPCVKALTIGSIQYDSATRDGDRWRYMCEETGVGSGHVYPESSLLPNEAEALSSANLLCAARSAEPENRTHYNAQSLAANSTMRALAIDDEVRQRQKFRFQAEDAARIVFDETRSDAECRTELKVLLEVVG